MEQITEIFIKDFRCLKYFSLELSPKDKLNINVFVGKNGSGKSTLLDALFEIGSNFKSPTTKFAFYIKNKDKIILGNRTENNLDNVEETELKNEIWNKVFRFYTGGTERCLEIRENINKNAISFQGNNLKWILFSTLLSGAWKNPQNEKLIEKFNSLLLDLKGFTLKNIYVDIKNEEKNEDILNLIKLAETTDKLSDNVTRYIIKWDDIKYEKDFSTSILETFTRNDNVLDTGFWYTKLHSGLLHSETLSDGELGLIRRFSLILLLKELKREEERSLVLLDEPETHFNENWKRHFIYLIEEALKDTYHDVFIATHSAMLITDVKRDELYHFELVNDKIKTFRCKNIHIHRNHPGVVHFDGDPMTAGTDIHVQLIQKGLNMLVNTQQGTETAFGRMVSELYEELVNLSIAVRNRHIRRLDNFNKEVRRRLKL